MPLFLLQIRSKALNLPFVTVLIVGEKLVELSFGTFRRATLEVAFALLDATQFTISGKLEALGCAFVCLDFWHSKTPDKKEALLG
jgi:hypothetical protein